MNCRISKQKYSSKKSWRKFLSPLKKWVLAQKEPCAFYFHTVQFFYADNAKESAVADFRVKTTDLSIQRYTRGGKDVILSHILSIRERLNLYGLPCHVNYRKACKRFEETWRVRLEHRKSYRRFVEAGRVRLDHRKTCKKLVEAQSWPPKSV